MSFEIESGKIKMWKIPLVAVDALIRKFDISFGSAAFINSINSPDTIAESLLVYFRVT